MLTFLIYPGVFWNDLQKHAVCDVVNFFFLICWLLNATNDRWCHNTYKKKFYYLFFNSSIGKLHNILRVLYQQPDSPPCSNRGRRCHLSHLRKKCEVWITDSESYSRSSLQDIRSTKGSPKGDHKKLMRNSDKIDIPCRMLRCTPNSSTYPVNSPWIRKFFFFFFNALDHLYQNFKGTIWRGCW